MMYAGYGGSWIAIVFVVLLLVRIFASRRGGPAGRPSAHQPHQAGDTVNRPLVSPSAPSAAAGGVGPGRASEPTSSYKIAPGWFPDPSGRFDQRYWSGTVWTEHVTKDGVPGTDAPPASLSGTG